MKNFLKQMMAAFRGPEKAPHPTHYDITDGDEGIDDERMFDEEGLTAEAEEIKDEII